MDYLLFCTNFPLFSAYQSNILSIYSLFYSERRLEYGNRNNRQRRMIERRNEKNDNLNREQDLILLD